MHKRQILGSGILKKFIFNMLIVVLTLGILIPLTEVIYNALINDKCKHEYVASDSSIAPSLFTVGVDIKECKKCQDKVSTRVNATVDLPQLYLEGAVGEVSKTTECFVKANYFEEDKEINCYATIKYQGHTSLAFDKKNFTIKFYKELGHSKKNEISFNGWSKTHKYCLKANYVDISSSRNIVSSQIWRDVVSSNPLIDNNLKALEFQGGIDGFPVALFINDEYLGVYTMNIPKDKDTYEIADDEHESMFVISREFSDSSKFKALITKEDRKIIYDLEYSYTEDENIAFDSMNNLISFVMNNDGQAFVSGIDQYLDVNAAIDYLITTYVLGFTANFSRNMILITYDGIKWIPVLYDLETAFGLSFDGTSYYNYDFAIPFVKADGTIDSNTDNLLWDRILNNYYSQFKSRYNLLRNTILEEESIIQRYSDFMNAIPQECFEYEKQLYPNIPFSDVNQIQQMTDFLLNRISLLDDFFKED